MPDIGRAGKGNSYPLCVVCERKFYDCLIVEGKNYCAGCFHDRFVETGKVGFVEPDVTTTEDGAVAVDGFEVRW